MKLIRCSRVIPLLWLICVVLFAAPVWSQDVVGDVYASDASVRGSVVLASGGTRVLSGSTVSAGLSSASVRLARGGEVRVCPGTNASLSSSKSGSVLALGFNTGAVELHYDLPASADTLQTSDFRLLLTGPGTFHLAVSADQLGNTCVRPLAHNTSSVIVQELFGDGSYQVKPNESVVFRKGHVADLSRDVPPDCGCPAMPEVKRADAESSPQRRGDAEAAKVGSEPASAPSDRPNSNEANLTMQPAGSPAPVEVESPFVFHADPAVPDPPVIARVRLDERARMLALQPTVLPPPGAGTPAASNREPRKPQQSKGLLARMRGFFAAMFK